MTSRGDRKRKNRPRKRGKGGKYLRAATLLREIKEALEQNIDFVPPWDSFIKRIEALLNEP